MKRPIPQLRTNLEFAPNTPENLIENIGSLACSRDRDCRYQNPFEDKHHLIYGQDLTEVEKILKCHPDFMANVCRCLHQQIHKTWNRSEPVPDDFGIGYLLASPVNVSPNNRRRLKEIRKSGQKKDL